MVTKIDPYGPFFVLRGLYGTWKWLYVPCFVYKWDVFDIQMGRKMLLYGTMWCKKKRATWDAKVAFGDEVCSSMGRKKLPQGRWLRPICISFSSHKNDLPPFWTHWDAYGAYWDNCVFREGALHEGAFLIFYLGLRFSANSATVSIYSFATFWLPWWIITENR